MLVTPEEKEIAPADVTVATVAPGAATLTVEDFVVYANGEAKMVVGLSNPKDQITLAQFDLRLPTGMALKNLGNDYDYELTRDRTTSRKHSVDANVIGDIVRFLISSTSSAVFTGTEGPIIEMRFTVGSNYSDGAAVTLENILLVTPEEKEIKPANVQATARKMGDVNTDGVVDVADIASIIGVMAGEKGSAQLRADVNGDNTVDVADIAAVISIMAQNARRSGPDNRILTP